MSDFDHERVSALLNIVAQCAGHSGKLGALSNEAMHELMEANDQVHQKATARKAKAEADAKAKQVAAPAPELKAEAEPVDEPTNDDSVERRI
jgi:hypothetical protein